MNDIDGWLEAAYEDRFIADTDDEPDEFDDYDGFDG